MLNNNANLKLNVSIIILIAFYVSGVVGILTNNQTIDFLSLTPLNLLVTAFLLLINHQHGTKSQWLVFFTVAVIGYSVELLGVSTGVIFGDYVYKTTLGWKLFETPLIIGVNWMILTYAAVYTVGIKIKSTIGIAFISACILVTLDLLIEPVAIKYDFWTWDQEVVPLKNYIAWFVISFFLCYPVAHYKSVSVNNFAPFLLIMQFVFFGIFNIFMQK
jgi:bisanhydrobacterioruberin hydratase